MQEIPSEIMEWTYFDVKTGHRKLKDNTPESIKERATEHERDFYQKTSRRRIINIEI